MKELFFIIYKKNPILHITCVILIFFSLYLILNQIIYKTNLQSYEDIFQMEHMDNFYYYSSDRELSNNFYGELEKIQERYPEAEIGYSLESTITTEEGQEFSVVYLNPVLKEIQYQLQEGTWISGENEIVVGKDVAKKFKVGSQLSVKNQAGEDTKWEIVGSLENSYVIEFYVSAEKMTVPFLVGQKENVIMTTSEELLDRSNIEYPRIGIILKIADKDKKEADLDSRLNCFTEIIRNTKEQCKDEIGNSNSLQVLLTIAILMNLIILSVYHLDERKEFLALAYICGLEKWKIIFLEVLQVLKDYMMAIFLIPFSKCIISDPDMVGMFLTKYVKNFLGSQVIFICILIVVYCAILNIRMREIMGGRGMKIELKNIRKSYETAQGRKEVIKGTSYIFPDNKISIIQGPSGCGKTTLLKILALLLKPEGGSYYFCGKEIDFHNTKELAWYRNQKIGYIMQDYKLVSGMTVYENILLPLLICKKKSYKQLEEMIQYMGLQEILEKKPEEISGGERQRAAIARAMVMQPELLLADEPTSALDKENAKKILELFQDITQKFGTTVIIATHDERIVTNETQVFEFS